MKMYLKETNEEITFGDVIKISEVFKHDYFGTVTSTIEVPLTEYNLQHFIDDGIIYTVNDTTVDYDIIRGNVISRMAKRYNWDEKRLTRILNTLDEVHPSAAVQMVLKEIALMLDEKYPGYIGKSEELYVISMGDGNIYPINKDNIKNFRNIAVFRTVGDAELAKNILGTKLTHLFDGK
jgi:hypothetical protein